MYFDGIEELRGLIPAIRAEADTGPDRGGEDDSDPACC